MSFGFGIGGMILGGVASLGMGMWGASEAKQAAQDAKEREDKAREEMDRLKEVYAGLDTSNPFLNMENTMEDLTINQKQSQFQAQQFAQSQANIMQGLRGATGGSGIAALAQSLAQQGQLASQKSAADIGRQESANQMARQQMAAQLQSKERSGEVMSRNWERDKQGTLLGMAQAETAAHAQQRQAAEQARWQAISGMASNVMDIGSSMMGMEGVDGMSKFAPEGMKWDPKTEKYVNK